MTTPIVIGYGNSLRQDDGVGLRAADLLEERLKGEQAEIVRCHQLTPELAPKLADRCLAVFLDAAADPRSCGVTVASTQPNAEIGFSHHLSPESLLALVRALHGRVPPAYTITAGLKTFELADHLTPYGEECAQRMAEIALGLVRSAGHRER